MNVAGYEWQSEFAKTHRGEGRAEGRAEGEAKAKEAAAVTLNKVRKKLGYG